MSELNPNHAVWHKIVLLLMTRLGIKNFEITPAMLDQLSEGDAVVLDARNGKMFVRHLTREEAVVLILSSAKQEGGLPV
jgi:hypothetical protein